MLKISKKNYIFLAYFLKFLIFKRLKSSKTTTIYCKNHVLKILKNLSHNFLHKRSMYGGFYSFCNTCIKKNDFSYLFCIEFVVPDN